MCNTSYVLKTDNKTCVPNITDCDCVLDESNGHVNVSGYPNYNCRWIIDLPAYKSIELKFIAMDIEQSPNCVKDHVIILNGKDENALPLGRYCGNKLPPTVHSSTESVVIKFTSDGEKAIGFSLQYRGLKERSKGKSLTCMQ